MYVPAPVRLWPRGGRTGHPATSRHIPPHSDAMPITTREAGDAITPEGSGVKDIGRFAAGPSPPRPLTRQSSCPRPGVRTRTYTFAPASRCGLLRFLHALPDAQGQRIPPRHWRGGSCALNPLQARIS